MGAKMRLKRIDILKFQEGNEIIYRATARTETNVRVDLDEECYSQELHLMLARVLSRSTLPRQTPVFFLEGI
jgi:hypothetical protein